MQRALAEKEPKEKQTEKQADHETNAAQKRRSARYRHEFRRMVECKQLEELKDSILRAAFGMSATLNMINV